MDRYSLLSSTPAYKSEFQLIKLAYKSAYKSSTSVYNAVPRFSELG